MANYEGITLTNDFSVTDEKKFQQLLSKLESDSEIDDYCREENGKMVHTLSCYGDMGYSSLSEDDYESDGEEYVCDFDKMCEELQKLLPDGEHVIIQTAGHEKLRYAVTTSTLITPNDIEYFNSNKMAEDRAAEIKAGIMNKHDSELLAEHIGNLCKNMHLSPDKVIAAMGISDGNKKQIMQNKAISALQASLYNLENNNFR